MDRIKDIPAEKLSASDHAAQAQTALQCWKDTPPPSVCSFKPDESKILPPLEIQHAPPDKRDSDSLNSACKDIENLPKGCALPSFEEELKNHCQSFTDYYHPIPGQPYRPPKPTGDSAPHPVS